MFEVDVIKLRSTTIHDGNDYGWEITCFEDITQIEYYEKMDGKKVVKHKYDFTAGYDIELFKEAIRLREEDIKENG